MTYNIDIRKALVQIELRTIALETRLSSVENRLELIPRIHDTLGGMAKELVIQGQELLTIKQKCWGDLACLLRSSDYNHADLSHSVRNLNNLFSNPCGYRTFSNYNTSLILLNTLADLKLSSRTLFT